MRPFLCLLSGLGYRTLLSLDGGVEKGGNTPGWDYTETSRVLTELHKEAHPTEDQIRTQTPIHRIPNPGAGNTTQKYLPRAKED